MVLRQVVHRLSWLHMWDVVAPIVRHAPKQIRCQLTFQHYRASIEMAIINGNRRAMEISCTCLYLFSLQQVSRGGVNKWW